VRNQALQKTVEDAVRRVFRANVSSYAQPAAAQPVRVFVGGFVHRPGLYNGTSMDSCCTTSTRPAASTPSAGSFLKVQVKRGDKVRASVNLYEFLLDGRMPLIQLADRRRHLRHAAAEHRQGQRPGGKRQALRIRQQQRLLRCGSHQGGQAQAQATHIRVVRQYRDGEERRVLRHGQGFPGQPAERRRDRIHCRQKPGTITVRVEGEHQSAQEYVLPYGAKLGELIRNIQFTPNSDAANLQLFRLSVRERQKQMLAAALKNLESSVLTARSATNEESRPAQGRSRADAAMGRARQAGRAHWSGHDRQAVQRDELLLESGDVIRVPKQDGLVLVSGEVAFPNTIAHDPKLDLQDYIKRAGGYSQSANTSRVIVAHRDGSFEEAGGGGWSFFGNDSPTTTIKQGDEILVLPKVKTKSIEVARGITQIIYQIAIAAKVILDL